LFRVTNLLPSRRGLKGLPLRGRLTCWWLPQHPLPSRVRTCRLRLKAGRRRCWWQSMSPSNGDIDANNDYHHDQNNNNCHPHRHFSLHSCSPPIMGTVCDTLLSLGALCRVGKPTKKVHARHHHKHRAGCNASTPTRGQ